MFRVTLNVKHGDQAVVFRIYDRGVSTPSKSSFLMRYVNIPKGPHAHVRDPELVLLLYPMKNPPSHSNSHPMSLW